MWHTLGLQLLAVFVARDREASRVGRLIPVLECPADALGSIYCSSTEYW